MSKYTLMALALLCQLTMYSQTVFSPYSESSSRNAGDVKSYTTNADVVDEILLNKEDEILVKLPVDGQEIIFRVVEDDFISSTFFVNNEDGVIYNIEETSKYLVGKDQTGNLKTQIVIENNQVKSTIYSKKDVTHILPNNGFYTTYNDSELRKEGDKSFVCESEGLYGEEYHEEKKKGRSSFSSRSKEKTHIGIHLFVDRYTFDSFGRDITTTTNWAVGIFNLSQYQFQQLDINLFLTQLTIEEDTDKYKDVTSTGQAYNVLRQEEFSGGLAHLLTRKKLGGGIAGVNTLCSTGGGYGVSANLGTSTSMPSKYSWNAYVVAHEMGHGFGSRHTHNCVWNGNGTAIDNCGPSKGYGSYCDPEDTSLPTSGTIMSYCHTVGTVGIDLNKGFHNQVSDVMMSNFQVAPCAMDEETFRSTLPVELLSFEGSLTSFGVELLWETTNEIDNEKFEVLHSTDGIKFKPIGSVQATDSPASINNYSFIHKGAPSGTNYYSLRQLDYNGESSLSKIISINIEAIDKGIYSNDNTIYLQTKEEGNFDVAVLNQLGQQVNNYQIRGVNYWSQRMDQLTPGMYYIKVTGNGMKSTKKMIIR